MFYLLGICFFFIVVYVVLILYYRSGWMSLSEYVVADEMFPTKITVIIPARDEEDNIGACLRSIVDQDFPTAQLQVIVVDDHSTDHTAEIVRSFSKKNVELLSLKDYISTEINSYKKKAIEIAIAKSSGELIITTDADCIVPPHWLRTIVSFYNEQDPKFIAMPVAYKTNGSFLQIFQALDFMTLQGITGASVSKGAHSMCNGANLAYSKAAFLEVDGFEGIDKIASGDDMLLMHKIARRYPDNIEFLNSPGVIVETAPMKTLKRFINQRIRWASKADKYDDRRIFWVLLVVYFFNVLLLALPFIAIWYNPVYSFHVANITVIFSQLELWVLMLIIKTWAELRFLWPVANFFGQSKLLWWFPVAQPFHIIYTVVAGWLGKFGTYQWKDRKVK